MHLTISSQTRMLLVGGIISTEFIYRNNVLDFTKSGKLSHCKVPKTDILRDLVSLLNRNFQISATSRGTVLATFGEL